MSKPTTTITAHKHTDRRANIPTEELRDFVADDEGAPPTLRYPRDPSLDPQLVWQGKDDLDGENLVVPAVNVRGAFGRWGFIEVADSWEPENMIRRIIQYRYHRED